MFAWMRPNDLWELRRQQLLLGNDPPANEILYWNNDTTRLPAQLTRISSTSPARTLVNRAARRPPATGSTCSKLGIEARNRRLCQSPHAATGVYRTAQLVGGFQATFVLSNRPHPEPRETRRVTSARGSRPPGAWRRDR
jgi:hypothetical protein